MKCVIVLLAAALAACVEGSIVPVELSLAGYHEREGIPALERIRQYEQGQDFDGHRIVGGNVVNAGAQPHLGGVFINLRDGRTSVCGSSLLTQTRALTAAHCWFDGHHQAVQFTMVYGSAFLLTGGVRVPTSQVQVHQDWLPLFSLENDIAIVTHINVAFSNTINRILLPSGWWWDQTFEGTVAVAAGFGRATDDSLVTMANPQKRQVALEVISNEECRRYYSNVVPSLLCTSGAGGVNVCSGDSGGPLATGSGGVLLGVTSFGLPQCTAGWPAAFTRVTSFIPWILSRI